MDRRSRSLPRALAAALALGLAPGCSWFRPFATVGPLVQQEFRIDDGDAADADLHVAFWGGTIDVAPDDAKRSTLVASLVARDNLDEVEPRSEERRDGARLVARLWLDSERSMFVTDDSDATNEWHVKLGHKLPLDLDLGLAACTGKVDLGGVPLRSAKVTLGAGQASLRFSAPNPLEMRSLKVEMGAGDFKALGLGNAHARSIHVEAGAGNFELDCSGEWRESALIHVEAGMCGVTIRVPRELAVRLDASETMFGDVTAPDFKHDGDDRYVTSNWDDGGAQLSIEVEASFGSVNVVRE